MSCWLSQAVHLQQPLAARLRAALCVVASTLPPAGFWLETWSIDAKDPITNSQLSGPNLRHFMHEVLSQYKTQSLSFVVFPTLVLRWAYMC